MNIKKNTSSMTSILVQFLVLLGRTSVPATTLATTPEQGDKPQPPTDLTMPPKPEPFKPTEEPHIFLEKPAFIPPKPISHSPKISPSSIPNPSPSISTTKQMEPGYPNYGGYLYSIPGYSAFQPVSYPGIMQPNQAPIQQNDTPSSEFMPFPSISKEAAIEDKTVEANKTDIQPPTIDLSKPQTDFEEQFTPEIIPAVSIPEANKNQGNESKMSITSLAQGSGATVTIPSQIKDPNKKATERFSLKTSIPISKLDMKCVNNTAEPILQNALTKKSPTAFSPAFQNQKVENTSKVEIQSNVVIKTAAKEAEVKPEIKQSAPSQNINTLINAAEAINKSEVNQFRKPEPKQEVINEIKDPPPVFTPPVSNATRPMFNPINLETNKVNFANKPPEFNEQKNQILFIQNKNPSNPKMLVTIQPQSSHMLLQRNNFDSKNLQAPSRLSSQSKKCKEELVENGMSSKVVALKRLHQENCDENDFENLITENQIYGNKIVVKEKSQGTLQEQDLKNKNKDKLTQGEPKNVVLQPNFLYLSNVQFPANLMMIKNNTRINQNNESSKTNKVIPNENKATNEVSTMTNTTDIKPNINNTKTQNFTANKEIHVLKSSNSVLTNKNNNDLIFQTSHQKVIVNPQIVYQVPMIVNADNKLNQPFINREYPKFITQNKEFSKQFEQPKSNDKLFIACPCQMDTKMQPKIVITNFRSTKTDIVSSLDIYEIRKRIRRQKYLSNRDTKDCQKVDAKKLQEKIDGYTNIITPDKMKAEIYKEFATTKVPKDEGSSESDSDYGEGELEEYNSIIKKFGALEENENGKVEFLANFRLATRDAYKEKELERHEKMLRRDSVALAYIAAGRIDRLTNEDSPLEDKPASLLPVKVENCEVIHENGFDLQKKQFLLSQLKLTQVTTQYKEEYEKTWCEIIKERKRRNGNTESNSALKQPKLEAENIDLDPNGQLQILTEIKKYVTDNNNLIKRRLDSCDNENEGDSIRVLAEKNFSELNRLSKMADRSVKLITGQDTKKRDLNPGFDSENIQKPVTIQQPFQNYPQINIPNISRIISLKTQETTTSSQVTTSQATSMDEPQNSAAGVTEMFDETTIEERMKDFSCQVEETFSWPGLETLIKSYREFEAARKKEISELHRRNTSLRVASAHVSRAAAHHSERARALLAERHHLAAEERAASLALQRLCRAVELVRNT